MSNLYLPNKGYIFKAVWFFFLISSVQVAIGLGLSPLSCLSFTVIQVLFVFIYTNQSDKEGKQICTKITHAYVLGASIQKMCNNGPITSRDKL